MKQIAVVSLAVLWGSLLFTAQSVAQSPVASGFGVAGMEGLGQTVGMPANIRTPANICPVVMSARHLAGGDTVKVGSAAHPKGIGQPLRLSFASRSSRQITAATIEVHGFADKGRMIQALSTSGSADANQTMQVQLAQEPDNKASATIWVPGMTAIETIDLESVTYADGSKWKASNGQSCHVIPDPLMLISSHAVAGR